jgi:hypothetical protein
MMIPEAHLQVLVADLTWSIACGRDGAPVAGYDRLQAGLRWAEHQAADGEPWGAALVQRYRQALDTYVARYSGKLK